MLHYCQLLFEHYILTGEKTIIPKLEKQFKAILAKTVDNKFMRIALTIQLLKGKLALLRQETLSVKHLFNQVKTQAQRLGYKQLVQQCEEELSNSRVYHNIDFVMAMQEEAAKTSFFQKQNEEILEHLKKIAIQLQIKRTKKNCYP